MLLSLSLQVEHTYTGPLDDELAEAMLSCDPEVRKAGHTPLASTVFLISVFSWDILFRMGIFHMTLRPISPP